MEIKTIILILFLVGFLSVILYAIKNLLIKIEKYEDIIQVQDAILTSLSQSINAASVKLKEHDSKGHYSSDDELGAYFRTLMEVDKVIQEYVNLIKDG